MTLANLCAEAAAGMLTSRSDFAERLYDRAKAEQWALDGDIDWRTMDLGSLPAPIRQALCRIYTHIQAGEVLALAMTARAVDAGPDLWAKMFGATQLMDEARHVEFFARVVAKLGEPVPLTETMLQFSDELDDLHSMDEILLATQIILEGYAQCLFLEGARLGSRAAERRIRLPDTADPRPFLSVVSRYVGRDESRHVAFGVFYLRERWSHLGAKEKQRLQSVGHRFSSLLEALIGEMQHDLRRVGIDAADLAAHVRRTRTTHFERIGFDK